jgi:hypothetical protein
LKSLLQIAILIFGLGLPACKKQELPEIRYRTYRIMEGKQSSRTGVELCLSQEMKFAVIFDSTAIYTSKEKKNQHAINKLYGFSDFNSSHHQNSARIGWRWLDERLEVWAYVYSEKERLTEFITYFEINKEYECSIKIEGEQYYFLANGKQVKLDRKCPYNQGVKYKLFPYFGGTEAAPQEIIIKLRDL